MKIVLIHCSFIYTGGGERIVLEQIDHLRKNGHDVECYAPVLDTKKCFPDIIDRYQIKTFFPQLSEKVPFRFAISLLLSCLLIPFFAVKFIDTELFIGENQPGAWLAFVLAKILRKPYIVYLNHPNRILYPRANEDWAAVKDFKFLSRIFTFFRPAIAYLDRISILSAQSRLVNGVFIGREIERIYHCEWKACPSGTPLLDSYEQRKEGWGVRIKRRFSNPTFPSDWYLTNRFAYFTVPYQTEFKIIQRPILNINGNVIDKPFVLYTGRHQPWKRIDWLIEMFSMALRNLKHETSLIIPGPFTPHTLELQKLAKSLGIEDRVLFLGEITQKELFTLYLNADVYAFPSEKEDFGIVVIEAMGYGLPVIAWNVGGPTDTVVDGVTGYLVEPYNKELYADKIAYLLNNADISQKMGEAGILRVAESFSWKTHMKTLESEIGKVMTAPGL